MARQLRGLGRDNDPVRRVLQIFRKDGTFLAEERDRYDVANLPVTASTTEVCSTFPNAATYVRELEVQRDLLAHAIRWALGENGEFKSRAAGAGGFWWRKELRARARL